MGVWTQPWVGSHMSWVQSSWSSQRPSSGVLVHPPVASQESVVHSWPSSQSLGSPGGHTPAVQRLELVHGPPSLHHSPDSGLCLQPAKGTQ